MRTAETSFTSAVCPTHRPAESGDVLLECGQTFRAVWLSRRCVWPVRTFVWRCDVTCSPVKRKRALVRSRSGLLWAQSVHNTSVWSRSLCWLTLFVWLWTFHSYRNDPILFVTFDQQMCRLCRRGAFALLTLSFTNLTFWLDVVMLLHKKHTQSTFLSRAMAAVQSWLTGFILIFFSSQIASQY